MLRTKNILLITLLVLCWQVSAQERLTLEQVLDVIESNNPGLKAFESRIRSKEARVEGARAWMSPMVGAGSFMTPYRPSEVMTGEDRGAWMLTAEQDIPNPAKTRAKAEYLRSRSAIDLAAKGASINELRAAGKQLYLDLLIAYRKVKFQEENLRIMRTMKKLAEIRYPYNQAGLNNVFKAEGRGYEAENMVMMTQSEIVSKKIALNALMNRAPQNALEIDTTIEVKFIPVAGLDTTYISSNRSDIQQMDQEIRSMRLNINQMRQEAKPDFRVRFEHMSNRYGAMPNQYTLMGMVSIPIAPWSSKMYKSEVKSMGFEVQGMQQEREAMLINLLGMTKAMEIELATMEEHVDNYKKKILPALSKNLRVSMLAYQENKMDLASVVDSWEAVNMAQMNYLDQLQRFYTMIVQYERSIQK